jgi:drug/metabolite transporter (DMT)-like permease
MQDHVTRRGWMLFAAMSVIWGMPYLFIKVAVEHVEPPVVVFARTAIAGGILMVVAVHQRVLPVVLQRWRPVLAFAVIEMGIPWLLLTNAEKRLPSGLSGLLVACVPLFGAFIAFGLGDHGALRPIRLAGIAVGFSGVALLVGRDLNQSGGIPWWSVGQVMIVCVCYATGPFIVARRLSDVSSLGVTAVAASAVALVFAPLAWLARPSSMPPATAVWSMVALGVICTAIAFITFFALIGEIGPARATLITYVNPAVAVVLGALFLDEVITGATIAGFVLVVSGCWLATRPSRAPTPLQESARP